MKRKRRGKGDREGEGGSWGGMEKEGRREKQKAPLDS